MATNRTIRIIMPHYGKDEMMQRCTAAINECGYSSSNLDFRIIDNNKENRLFTKAINEGLRGLKPDETAWLINNDCVPQPGCIDAALKCFDEVGDRCGIVGSMNIGITDSDKILWGGSQQCFAVLEENGSERLLGGVHKTGSVKNGDLSVRSEEEWVTFASVFIGGRLVQEIGLLDENMRHVCSDSDYCLRARWARWSCWYEPKSIVKHDFGSSTKILSDQLMKVISDDMTYFRMKWMEPTLKYLTKYPTRLRVNKSPTGN